MDQCSSSVAAAQNIFHLPKSGRKKYTYKTFVHSIKLCFRPCTQSTMHRR